MGHFSSRILSVESYYSYKNCTNLKALVVLSISILRFVLYRILSYNAE